MECISKIDKLTKNSANIGKMHGTKGTSGACPSLLAFSRPQLNISGWGRWDIRLFLSHFILFFVTNRAGLYGTRWLIDIITVQIITCNIKYEPVNKIV